MLNPFTSTLSISSSYDFYALIAKCNYCISVQTVLTQCWCESLENASFDSHMCSHFTAIFSEICKELFLQKQNKEIYIIAKSYKAKQKKKKNLNPAFWTPTSRQTNIYIHTCLRGSSAKIHKATHVHTFWKSTDARQSLGCMNCKICLKVNIWNI